MTKIDIFSGFLGAGKTTLIKKLITEAFAGQQVVLIENEFGEIGIDGGFLKESGIQINELNAGCICCSLVGDFRTALQQVVEQYHPDRIVIEPSGVGKLSDVTRAVEGVAEHLDVQLNSFVTVADVNKVKMYMKNFGEFYDDQISHASCILLSRTQTASEEKIAAAVAMLREKNPTATIVTTAWDHLTGEQILKAMSTKDDFKAELIAMAAKANEEHAHEDEEEEHEHHHHHYDENGVCSCGHHHDHDDDDDDEDEHEHHHHDHDEHDHDDHCCCGHHHDHDHDEDDNEHEHEHEHHHDHDEHDHEEHEHHHDHDGHCCCGHHHHDHHADEVFTSWGVETARKFTKAEVEHALTELDTGNYGMILRSKGIVDGGADGWLEFDYVPGEWEVRSRSADVGGKLVVIGSKLNETAIAQLFGC
jgi:G3E family GTPase